MLMKIIAEGLGLSAILLIICAVGIRNGAVGMIHLYYKDVQDKCMEMGLTGFLFGFLHIFAILSIVNLFDRFVIDVLWVEHTNARTIPGTLPSTSIRSVRCLYLVYSENQKTVWEYGIEKARPQILFLKKIEVIAWRLRIKAASPWGWC